MNDRSRWLPGPLDLAHSRGDARGAAHVALGVDLHDVGIRVAEEDLRGLEAELLADARGIPVPELVRVPAAGLSPDGEFLPLLPRQALLSLAL